MNHFVYILRCADDTFYTGYTTDVEKRVKAHNLWKSGAKYTSGRRPVEVIYSEIFQTKEEAMKREYEIKQMKREGKIRLISTFNICK